MSTHHAEIPSVIPSAPPLIGDYPAPPTGHNDSTVGGNQREHGAPSEQTHSTMPQPPSYSSLFSVPTPRYSPETNLRLFSVLVRMAVLIIGS